MKSIDVHQSRIKLLEIVCKTSKIIIELFNIFEIHIGGSPDFSHGNHLDDATADIRRHLIETVTM